MRKAPPTPNGWPEPPNEDAQSFGNDLSLKTFRQELNSTGSLMTEGVQALIG